MKHLSSGLLFLLPLLTACGGGGGSSSAPFAQAAMSRGPGAATTLSETQSDAMHLPAPAVAAGHLLYVGNRGNNSITVYPHDAAGNASPTYVIAGPKTGINDPGQLSEDAAGNLYVANGTYDSYSTNPAILVFAHGARGNVAPIRKIAGPLTGIRHVAAMTVDAVTGKMFVMDYAPAISSIDVRLLRFPPNANGNAAPFARSAGGLLLSLQLASDSTGSNIIDAHTAVNVSDGGVEYGAGTLPKQFPNGASLSYIYHTSALGPLGIADDPTTKTYLATAGAVYRFAENTVGSDLFGPDFTPPIVSEITSDTCGSQLAVPQGAYPPTYVVHSGGRPAPCANPAVYVYAENASGNAAPLRFLSGPATKLDQPYGIYVGT